jgi:hypothetical protein
MVCKFGTSLSQGKKLYPLLSLTATRSIEQKAVAVKADPLLACFLFQLRD